MDEKLPEKNCEIFQTVNKEEEEMEVPVTTQLQNLIVRLGNAGMPSESHLAERGVTEPAEALSLGVIRKAEDCDEHSDRKDLQTPEEKEMEVALTAQQGNLATLDNTDMRSNSQKHPEEAGAAAADPASQRADESVRNALQTPKEKEMKVTQTSTLCLEDCDEDESEDSDSDSSSSSSSSSSCSSSSSPSAPVCDDDYDDEGFSQPAPIKTRDEVLLEELPAVEDVSVSLPEDAELEPLGTVSSILQQLVIVQSLKDTPPLNDDTIVFTSDRLAVGKVFEVFGPVASPLYILRFNCVDQIGSKGLTEGLTVYYAPAIKEYTGYILTQQLKLLKGSDASWKNDQEPPEEALDYSDDEREQEAKRNVRNSKKRRDNNNPDKPAHVTQNLLQPQHQHDVKGFQSQHAGASFRHQNLRNKQPPVRHTLPPPRHTNVPPMYLPPPCPYPPPFPPPNFPLYPPPPPLPALPAFFNPSFSTPFWPPNCVPFSEPPPPPPQ